MINKLFWTEIESIDQILDCKLVKWYENFKIGCVKMNDIFLGKGMLVLFFFGSWGWDLILLTRFSNCMLLSFISFM